MGTQRSIAERYWFGLLLLLFDETQKPKGAGRVCGAEKRRERKKKERREPTRPTIQYVRGCGCFVGCVLMILPQVHLRKPCYDFSFLEMFRFK